MKITGHSLSYYEYFADNIADITDKHAGTDMSEYFLDRLAVIFCPDVSAG